MQIRNKLTLSFILTLLSVGLVYAINTVFTGFKITSSVDSTTIDAHGECREVSKKSGFSDIFVPTRTSNEWTTFIGDNNGGIVANIDECPTITPIDGVCDSTHYNCLIGNSIDNQETSTQYTWSCEGIDDGNTVNCTEDKEPICYKSWTPDRVAVGPCPDLGDYNCENFSVGSEKTAKYNSGCAVYRCERSCVTPVGPICGSEVDTCNEGVFMNIPSDTATEYRWSCFSGGDYETCTSPKNIGGQGPTLAYSKTLNGSHNNYFFAGDTIYGRVETTSPYTNVAKIKACAEFQDLYGVIPGRNDTHCSNESTYVYLDPRDDRNVSSGLLRTVIDSTPNSSAFVAGLYRLYVYYDDQDLGFTTRYQTNFTITGCTGSWSNTSTCSETCGGGVLQQVYSGGNPSNPYCPANGTTRWGDTTCNTQACTPSQVDGECEYGPTINECSRGTFANPTSNAHYYFWDCLGANGGEDVSCQQAEDSSCSNQVNTCNGGSVVNISSNSDYYLWECTSNYGSNIECSLPKPTNGVCKTGRTVVNECEAGEMVDTTDSWVEYKWDCKGLNGGSDVSCTTPINVCREYYDCRPNWTPSGETWITNCEVEWTCSRGSYNRTCFDAFQQPPSNNPGHPGYTGILYHCQ